MNEPEQTRDPVSVAWHHHAGDWARVPAPETIAACRAVASDARLLRLVRQLGLERQLTRYATGTAFLDLVKKLTNDPRARSRR
jgi:hypothetical protein